MIRLPKDEPPTPLPESPARTFSLFLAVSDVPFCSIFNTTMGTSLSKGQSEQVETTQMSMDWRVVYLYGSIHMTEWSKDTCSDQDEPRKHNVKWKKPVTKDNLIYISTYMRCLESTETERKGVIAGIGGRAGWRATATKRCRVSFWGDGNVANLICGDGCAILNILEEWTWVIYMGKFYGVQIESQWRVLKKKACMKIINSVELLVSQALSSFEEAYIQLTWYWVHLGTFPTWFEIISFFFLVYW